jgi:putative tryptophan/tyrosine transport system substrate-binding protein
MKRREFIGLLGGATIAWPLATRAQKPERMRHVCVLENLAPDAQRPPRIDAFVQGLQQSGWVVGRNLRLDYRSAAGNLDDLRKFAAEFAALSPDVILAVTSPAVGALLQATHNVPVVFVQVIDPVGAGFVSSLARPGGNATGFMLFEFSLSGKWLELLKEVAPGITRVAVVRDPAIAAGTGQFGAIQAVAPSFGVELTPVNVHDAAEIERGIGAFARGSSDGLIVTASPLAVVHYNLIVNLAARYRLPAVYFARLFATANGLIAYGADVADQYRGAAGYVDRILRGEKPGDLPVQIPTKFELVINLKTAKALGLTIPSTLLARADEVIE